MNKDLLARARDLLVNKGWTQGAYSVDANGIKRLDDGPGYGAVAYCAVGAVLAEGGRFNGPEHQALRDAAGGFLTGWNDHSERTKEEVIALFDKVIA